MSQTIPAVCPVKGNNSWVVRARIAEGTLSRSHSASLLASCVRPDHSSTKGVGSTCGTVSRRRHPRGREDPLPGLEPRRVLGLALEYRPLPYLIGRGYLGG